MNFDSVEKIARAVLYEGYILYPYRPSSTKNQQRWNFGTLYPREWAELQRPAESCRMITECLIRASDAAKLNIRASFLQFVPKTESWEQGIERWSDQNELALSALGEGTTWFNLAFRETNKPATLKPLQGNLSLKVEEVRKGIYRLTLELLNNTPVLNPNGLTRTAMLLESMISAHLLLGIENGEFISLLDPPEELREAAQECQNVGAFPVLVGEEGERAMMLSSPIILYDYPQIAPESSGDFFDGTEMDEMLALRVMTLSEEEKQVMRNGDEQARRILERTELLPEGHWMKIHGAIRGMRRVEDDESQD